MHSHLKPVSSNEKIIIDPTNGEETIATATKLFSGHIDDSFNDPDINIKDYSTTKPQPVNIYEVVKKDTFKQIYGSFGINFDQLCLTQAQIIRFVRQYRNYLRVDGYGTFFLFKANVHFFCCAYLF